MLESVVAAGAISLVTIWYRLTLQWHGYQAIAFYRMKEIESELGMWHYRYSLFIRKSSKERKELIEGMPEDDKSRVSDLQREIVAFQRLGVRLAARIMTCIVAMGWLLLVIRDVIALLS